MTVKKQGHLEGDLHRGSVTSCSETGLGMYPLRLRVALNLLRAHQDSRD